ncbi:uncharacterized protein G2W53_018519 [Senna tora]|uniref:Uncharacterized protein n=1 Tax=Senna tora TaxID=362788 RepID=A0A834TRY6_9FABA|nr:uncharacterized protein G2W53_018519 [Senna tora]
MAPTIKMDVHHSSPSKIKMVIKIRSGFQLALANASDVMSDDILIDIAGEGILRHNSRKNYKKKSMKNLSDMKHTYEMD